MLPTSVAVGAQRGQELVRPGLVLPLHAAGRLGNDTLARANEHLLDLTLVADDVLARDFVDTRLAPLQAMKPAARDRATETLRAWLDAHGDVTATARALHIHPQSVRYRLARLRETDQAFARH